MRLRIRELRQERGWTLDELASAAGISRALLNQFELGDRRPNTLRLEQIARALGVRVSDLIENETVTIPILGRVGAGAEVWVEGQEAPIGEVALPEQLRGRDEIAAVLVEGDSMEPLIPAGSVLFYRRHGAEGVPSEAMGRVCVAEDEEGRVWVKQVKQGTEPGLHHLLAVNERRDTSQFDVRLRWAAPILMWLPPELVQVRRAREKA